MAKMTDAEYKIKEDQWAYTCLLDHDNEKFQKEIKDLKQEIILLNCKLSSEKLSRAPRLWKEMKEENEKLKKENENYKRKWDMFNVKRDLDIVSLVAEFGSDNLRICLEENEKLKKENKSITSHRDRLLRRVKRLTKAAEEWAEEWDEGTNHLAIQILNQSQELDKVKKELKFLKKENETRRASWGN